MPIERWDRFAPLTGIWAVLFWVLGVVVLEGVAGTPADDTPEAILAFFEGEENGIYLGSIFFFVGSAILIWWAGALRASIAAAGGHRRTARRDRVRRGRRHGRAVDRVHRAAGVRERSRPTSRTRRSRRTPRRRSGPRATASSSRPSSRPRSCS